VAIAVDSGIAEPLKTRILNHKVSIINPSATETAPTEKPMGKNTIFLLTEIFPEIFKVMYELKIPCYFHDI
jgi:hypothetical protein